MTGTPASGDSAPLLARGFCFILQLLGITLPDWSKKKTRSRSDLILGTKNGYVRELVTLFAFGKGSCDHDAPPVTCDCRIECEGTVVS
jgi:hypothetical protein